MANSIIRYTPWEVAYRDGPYALSWYVVCRAETATSSWVRKYEKKGASRLTAYFATQKMAQKKADQLNAGATQ